MATIKPEKTPSLFGVYINAAIMICFGGILGFFYLTTFPAQAFANMPAYEAARAEADSPEIPKPGDGFYIEGPILASRSWEAKRRLLNEPGPQAVSLSAGEMNMWMDSHFSAALETPGVKGSNLVVIPGIPNFAVVEGQGFYINLPLSIFIFGTKYECTLTALGSVTSDGFQARSVSLNSAALPLPSILGEQVLVSLAKAFQSTEDYKIVAEAFTRVESITMEPNALVLSLR